MSSLLLLFCSLCVFCMTCAKTVRQAHTASYKASFAWCEVQGVSQYHWHAAKHANTFECALVVRIAFIVRIAKGEFLVVLTVKSLGCSSTPAERFATWCNDWCDVATSIRPLAFKNLAMASICVIIVICCMFPVHFFELCIL